MKSRNGEEENPFLLSFSDLMASLLAIFILALIVMMIQLHQKQRELESEREEIMLTKVELLASLKEIKETQDAIDSALSGARLREQSLTSLLEGVQEDLKKKGIEVIVAENGSVLRIPERALSFGLGRFEIQKEFHPTADAIGTALLEALQRPENLVLLDTVFIEGHTDAVPNTREMGNWGLSAYRAISLWKFWTEVPGNCAPLRDLKTADPTGIGGKKPLISASGYAETRPTGIPSPEPQVDGRPTANSADRRIDIRFTLASAEKKDLEGLGKKVSEMREKTQSLINLIERKGE
jgi:flagellar motor protein MotB